MTAEYEPYEMVERHGVGNILRLLWAYALHRVSQRLAYRCQRVMAKAGFTNVSWAEIPSAQDAYLPDAVRDHTPLAPAPWTNEMPRHHAEEARVGSAQRPASSVSSVMGEETRRESEFPSGGARRLMRIDAAPGKPEPWFRALQETHRIQTALEERMPFVREEADPVHRDTITRDPKSEDRLDGDTSEKEHRTFEPSLLDENDNRADSPTKPIEITMPESTLQSYENREASVFEPPRIESTERAAKGSDVFDEREHIHPHSDVAQVAMIPEREHVELSASRELEPEPSMEIFPGKSPMLEQWPSLPQESGLVPQPGRTRRDLPREQDAPNDDRPTRPVAFYDPPEEAAPADRPARAREDHMGSQTVWHRESASADRRARAVGEYVRPAQHEVERDELEGAWPTLPEDTRYAREDNNLERYQRGQRRWNEQRGIL
jgi:hypothetical protein